MAGMKQVEASNFKFGQKKSAVEEELDDVEDMDEDMNMQKKKKK